MFIQERLQIFICFGFLDHVDSFSLVANDSIIAVVDMTKIGVAK